MPLIAACRHLSPALRDFGQALSLKERQTFLITSFEGLQARLSGFNFDGRCRGVVFGEEGPSESFCKHNRRFCTTGQSLKAF